MQELLSSAQDVLQKAKRQHADLAKRTQQLTQAGVPANRLHSSVSSSDAALGQVQAAFDAVIDASNGRSRVRLDLDLWLQHPSVLLLWAHA